MTTNSNTFVAAVSGGVDSVVLLDALANHRLNELTGEDVAIDSRLRGNDGGVVLIVAHFDHGMREDSAGDCEFVRSLAEKYGLQFESERAELGPEASEAEAREVRYNFLRRCCKNNNASLVLAHHQDDLIETMIINLIRGTGWRGLVSLEQISELKDSGSHDQLPTTNYQLPILRPLLVTSKSDIFAYAKKYKLEWREDSTNENQKYLRNRVRHEIIPAMLQKDPECVKKLLDIQKHILGLKKEIATELQNLFTTYSVALPTTHHQLSTIYTIPRYQLITWPDSVSTEVIYQVLTTLDRDWHPTQKQIERVLWFVKTAHVGKKLEVGKHLQVSTSLQSASFQFLP